MVDDVLPPFHPRSITVQGTAQALEGGDHGRIEAMIRIVPTTIISWGLDDTAPSP